MIDDYDAPFLAGYVNGYYRQVADFMLGLLGAALKDNSDLERGILTGRFWPEMDSRLNNLAVYTLLRHGFDDKFGLTELEAGQILKDFHGEDQYQNVKKWYNGYRFADTAIYNPCSMVHYLQNPGEGFKPHWLNSDDLAVIARLLTENGTILKSELENLINGESIEKNLDEMIALDEMARRDDQLWSFLPCNGYLRYEAEHRNDFNPARISYQLAIPNCEVRSIYIDIVQQWFASRMENGKLGKMLRAFIAGEIKELERFLRELVENIYRNHDLRKDTEKVYHAFATGLLVWLGGDYELKSNCESGYGRYDLMIIPKNKTQIGYVIEFKKVSAYGHETVELAIANAFAQIEAKGYETELRQRDVKTIKKLAVVFQGKQVWVKEA